MPSLTEHLDALLLALASSTDNFTVGISIGIGGHNKDGLPIWVNAFISICNATGALLAGFGGILLSQRLPPLLAPLVAAMAFGVLAIQELALAFRPKEKHKHKVLELSQVARLAVPMTLNNIAGGVAGGAAGLSPLVTAVYALLASFLTMAVGHWIGHRLGTTTTTRRIDPSLVSGCLLGALCLLTLHEAFL